LFVIRINRRRLFDTVHVTSALAQVASQLTPPYDEHDAVMASIVNPDSVIASTGIGTTVSIDTVVRIGMVGDAVGCAVGDAVGCAVGDAVGFAVGLTVGTAVGCPVGDAVGFVVGEAVGDALGCPVGEAVGFVVGEPVGADVGSVVGDHVSPDSVGDCVVGD